MNAQNLQRLDEARRYGDRTRGPNPVCYEWGLQNINGAWYRLLREPHHTDEDISTAKSYLRNNQDVVSLTVERIT